MKEKIKVPSGFPTLAEIVKDYRLTKAEVQSVEALLDRPSATAGKAVKTVKRGPKSSGASPTKRASMKSGSKGRTSPGTKAGTIRQIIAAKRSNSNHSR